ncbi:MAG TPA: single-stranded-DNA-specific exonuclease RecJ [Terriglobales bacterium]
MRWIFKEADKQLVKELAQVAGISPVAARLLANRGINSAAEAQRFLSPSLDHLHSPYLMLGMKAAVERLQRAIANRERMLIYGDYDVDGTTAVVILKRVIEMLGGSAEFHVPHRIQEGYGMRDEVIERAAANGVQLVISVDTGIRAFAAAETARQLGLDLIVTDHHLPEAGGVPHALAVLNPNQAGCGYPCKFLCGAGVAFKIAQALLEARDEQQARSRLLPSFLKMVAIATIADAVPLVDENRVITKLGLEGLRDPRNPGLRALMQITQLEKKQRSLTAADVAFRIAPRINAAGRMDVAQTVIDLFNTRDASAASLIAQRLDALNSDRQETERTILKTIEARLAEDAGFREASCIVLDGEGWHRGVIGITASRVVERTGKPALVLSRNGDEAHGSGRSIPAFHLLQALESCHELFTRFGGHAHAVGFSLACENIPALRERINAHARACLTLEDFVSVLELDERIALHQVTPDLVRELKQFEPFGMGNPEPVFMARNVRLLLPPKILKEKHAKLRVTQENTPLPGTSAAGRPTIKSQTTNFDALGWRMAERISEEKLLANDVVDLAFTLEENVHPEFGGLQLSICDLKRAQPLAQAETAGAQHSFS